MRRHPDELSTLVILSGAKDLTRAKLITLRKQRDSKSWVGSLTPFVMTRVQHHIACSL
jgi:hypothetical protein